MRDGDYEKEFSQEVKEKPIHDNQKLEVKTYLIQ